MAAHNGKYLKVSLRGDRSESIPVSRSFKIPDLDEEWIHVDAADKSVIVMRVSEIETIHLTHVKVA